MEKKLPRILLETKGTEGDWALRIVEYDDECFGQEQRTRDLMGKWRWEDCESEDFLERLQKSLSQGGLNGV